MLSYPVEWTKSQILRDIVQNFYDDAGASEFLSKLKKTYEPTTREVTISMKSNGFSYEWLLHMGASTKQKEPGRFAGFYGEGFKVASLCALRDYEWRIFMRSRNWAIEVCAIEADIDGTLLEQLAYTVEEGLENSPDTYLTIGNFSIDDYILLDGVILGFYFPENPLFGETIFVNDYVAIYERSKMPKPQHFPSGLKLHGDGLMYIGYQVRSAFFKPIVLCSHLFKTHDRDRKNVYLGTVLEVMLELVDMVDVKTACWLLEKLDKYWYEYPSNKRDVDSWYSLIRKLIRKIVYGESNSIYLKDFMTRNSELVVCEQPTNITMRNKKTQSLAWMKHHQPSCRLVQDGFLLMGYESIVDLCERAGGFNITRLASEDEVKLLEILKCSAKEIFSTFFEDYPDCRIIDNESSVFNGTANLIKKKAPAYNHRGFRIRYTIISIDIKKALLAKGNFANAFSTYCHELCHCFGGDTSSAFSLALTDVIAIAASNLESIRLYEALWNARIGTQNT